MSRPWMPMYWGDYHKDTLDLSLQQHGAYMLLLMIAWNRPDGALPNDMKFLKSSLSACVSDMHGNRFNRLVPPLLKRYFRLDPETNSWHQGRLQIEREKAEKISRKAKENANKRWAAYNEINGLPHAKAYAVAMHTTITKKESSFSSEPNPAREATAATPQGAVREEIPISSELEAKVQQWEKSGWLKR